MRKHFLLPFLIFLLAGTSANAQQQDSIYFYKDGVIVYSEATTQIDSMTFLASDYYDLQRSEVIFEELLSHPELSLFTGMIQAADMQDELINKTIWAPNNDAFKDLDDKDLLDMNLVRRILNNQMCNNQITTTFASTGPRKVQMCTGKNFTFSKSVSGYELAGNPLLKTDIKVANSIIHIVDGKNPYPLNIWEYIEQSAGLDSLRSYIRSLNTVQQYKNVYVDGIFKDSFTVVQNDVLDYLAKIDSEDSIYTVLLPNNEAFTEAFDRLLPYCKSTAGAQVQSDAAKWMILKELFFRGKHTIPLQMDFIHSVSGTKYLHPDSLFLNASSAVSLTNGMVYGVNHLKAFEPGFQKRNRLIEAENKSENKLIATNYITLDISNTFPGLPVSNGKFLHCIPTSSSALSQLTIIVPIPNTLSMKYNVYAVFVPSIVTDTTDLRPYKLDLYLSTNGDTVNGLPTFTKMNVSNIITKPTEITKVLVASNQSFPYCSIVHDPKAPSKILLKIRNMGGMSSTELKNYNRSMRIDYFLLEPAE